MRVKKVILSKLEREKILWTTCIFREDQIKARVGKAFTPVRRWLKCEEKGGGASSRGGT